MSHRRRHPAMMLACLLLPPIIALSACSMKVMKPTSSDTAREREARLIEENRELKDRNAGLQARIDELTADRPAAGVIPEAARPRLVAMAISSSSVVESAPSGADRSTLVLRLAPRDDRGRFMQVVGSLEVRAVSVPETGDPALIASVDFDPLEVREAWRGGILGSGYVFELELDRATDQLPPTIDVVTIFREATSGHAFREEAPVAVAVAPDR